MKECFIIFKRRDPEFDRVLKESIYPALKSCDLKPVLTEENFNVQFNRSKKFQNIKNATIILADVTHDLPEIYFEIGFSMGFDKVDNLILIANKDFDKKSPNYKSSSKNKNINLTGLNILYLDSDDLMKFRKELEKLLISRLQIISSSTNHTISQWDENWYSRNQSTALFGLKRFGKSGFMEIRITISDTKIELSHKHLLEAAYNSQIKTFGWPIGCVVNDIKQRRPRARKDGIFAEIENTERGSYDFWSLRRDASFYILKTLYEDTRKFGYVSLNIRIARIAEALMYASNIYSFFKINSTAPLLFGIRHGGLKERILTAIDKRYLHRNYKAVEESIYNEVQTNIQEIEDDLTGVVLKFAQPLFVVFDFFHVDRNSIEPIVVNFKKGKMP